MISDDLLEVLVCPETKTRLAVAEPQLVDQLNQAIASGTLKNRAGQAVESSLEGGLIREDGTVLYPIVDGIPIMLVDEAIPIS